MTESQMDRITSTKNSNLTPVEREVLLLIAQGKSNDEIGVLRARAFATSKNHVKHILSKLGAASRAGAVGRGFELGYLTVQDGRVSRA